MFFERNIYLGRDVKKLHDMDLLSRGSGNYRGLERSIELGLGVQFRGKSRYLTDLGTCQSRDWRDFKAIQDNGSWMGLHITGRLG